MSLIESIVNGFETLKLMKILGDFSLLIQKQANNTLRNYCGIVLDLKDAFIYLVISGILSEKYAWVVK